MFKNSDRNLFAYIFLFEKVGVDFRNPLPFRRLSAKSIKASTFGVSAARYSAVALCKFLQSSEDYS
ncbi:hypothetical protein AM233_22100 [Bacillus sp. FJAT-22058]|nr:hypothetical protein AM233_22100 [Bacillus sp. FJAT-22058]